MPRKVKKRAELDDQEGGKRCPFLSKKKPTNWPQRIGESRRATRGSGKEEVFKLPRAGWVEKLTPPMKKVQKGEGGDSKKGD